MVPFLLQVLLALVLQAIQADVEKPKETTKLSPVPTTKLTLKDARDKRALNDFGSFLSGRFQSNADNGNVRQHNPNTPTIQRRISNYGVYPGVQNNRKTYDSSAGNYIGGFASDYTQQYEAPEPIIEIIIKESNESVPSHQPIAVPPPKKKKEEVQVFYVKYKKDEKSGLHIEDPIPGKKKQN